MSTIERERTDDVRALEELWAAPPAPEPELTAVRTPPALRRPLGPYLASGWIAFVAAVAIFQPDPEPGMAWPAWMVAASAALYLLLPAAAFVAVSLPPLGYAAAVVAGGLGMALAFGCRAAEHHLGNWWLAELGATGALTGLAALGLVRALRRE